MFPLTTQTVLWGACAVMAASILALRILIAPEKRAPRTPDEHSTHYDSMGTFHAESIDNTEN